MIKPAYSVSFLLSINIFVWQNVLCFPNDPSIFPSRCLNHSLHRNVGSEKHVMTFTSDKRVVMADRTCKQKKGIQQAENRKAVVLLSLQ